MRRNEWQFEYQAGTLAEAAAKKRQHHEERLDWWKAKRKEVMETIRAEGLEFDEKIVVGVNTSMKGRDWDHAAKITVRDDLRTRLDECQSKLSWHTDKLREYDGWHQALVNNAEVPLHLHIDDWLFFFGK